MICPVCHKPVRDTANFCEHCGSKLSSFRMCPNPKCRQHVNSTAKFCPHCGTNINTGELSPALKELFRFAIGGYYGYKSKFDGNVYIDPLFDSAEEFEGDYAIVGRQGLYGVINRMGKYILEKRFSSIIKPSSRWNYWICKSDEGVVFLLPDNFEPASELYSDVSFSSYFAITKSVSGKKGIIDSHLKQTLECEYDEISPLSSRRYAVKKDGQNGWFSVDRGFILPCEYDEISPLSSSQYAVKKDGQIGLFSEYSGFIIPRKYKSLSPHSLGFIVENDDGMYGIYSPSGRIISDCTIKKIEEYGSCYRCTHMHDNIEYISVRDKDGRIIIPDSKYQSVSIILENYYVVQDSSGRYGFLSLSGVVLTNCVYDKVGEARKINKGNDFFHLIQVCINQLWGVLRHSEIGTKHRLVEVVPCISPKPFDEFQNSWVNNFKSMEERIVSMISQHFGVDYFGTIKPQREKEFSLIDPKSHLNYPPRFYSYEERKMLEQFYDDSPIPETGLVSYRLVHGLQDVGLIKSYVFVIKGVNSNRLFFLNSSAQSIPSGFQIVGIALDVRSIRHCDATLVQLVPVNSERYLSELLRMPISQYGIYPEAVALARASKK